MWKTILIIGGSVLGACGLSYVSYKVGKSSGLREAGVDPAEHKEEKRRKREEARKAA